MQEKYEYFRFIVNALFILMLVLIYLYWRLNNAHNRLSNKLADLVHKLNHQNYLTAKAQIEAFGDKEGLTAKEKEILLKAYTVVKKFHANYELPDENL